MGNKGYRFCNFMDVSVELTTDGRSIKHAAFRPWSGIYRGPSFAGIPSHVFAIIRETTSDVNSKVFTQTVGARTVSPEKIGRIAGALAGGAAGTAISPGIGTVVGAVGGYFTGETVAHQVTGFPPIWSKLQIRIFVDGTAEVQLVQHSIFPSLTLYEQLESTSVLGLNYARVSRQIDRVYYNATKEVQLPDWKENGWGEAAGTAGPCKGNPWSLAKGITGGDSSDPN